MQEKQEVEKKTPRSGGKKNKRSVRAWACVGRMVLDSVVAATTTIRFFDPKFMVASKHASRRGPEEPTRRSAATRHGAGIAERAGSPG